MKTVKHSRITCLSHAAFVGSAMSLAASAWADPVGHDCILWLKADEGVTVDGATRVTAAADFSGAGHGASNVTGDGPVLVAGAVGGRPAMRFAGGQWLSLAGQVLSSDQYTIIAVVTDTRSDGSFREVFSNWTFSNAVTSVFFGTTSLNPAGADTTRARLTDDVGGANQGQTGVGVVQQRSAPFIFTGISRTSNAEVYQNRTLIAGRDTPISVRNLAGPYVIGRQGPISEFWVGDIAEVLMYNVALSRCELDAAYDSLNGRYGLAPCLPVITAQPGSGGVCPGGSIMLGIQAGGGLCNPNFSYRWSRGGVPLSDGGQYAGSAAAMLVISAATAAVAGSYSCTVTNSCGSVTSDAATVAFSPRCSLADIAGTVSPSPSGPVRCGDDAVDGADFIAFINSFSLGNPQIDALADVAGGGADGFDPDGTIDGADFIAFINAFAAGC